VSKIKEYMIVERNALGTSLAGNDRPHKKIH